MKNTDLDKRLVQVVPSERQLALEQLEFYAFVHFSPNTFTNREWGDGTESPQIFNPSKLDTDQWASAIKSAGMKGMILTCRHHDGFCLWHTKTTAHSVMNSPFKKDVVRMASDSCRRFGLKFGVYLSPWDRNCAVYGSGKQYDDFFVSQLTELLTNYGDVFSVWLDGACGEGPNGKKQLYDWERYHQTVRKLQPGACINVCGPDVRWCGNEAGFTRKSEWSVVPERTKDCESIAKMSQQADDQEFRRRKISSSDADLGSRAILENEPNLIWYPAEVNTSIRPGWFWHEIENDKVRSLDELVHIYNNSVGGNATFLLNIPPTNEGLFHQNDVARLAELGKYLDKTFAHNLLESAAEKGRARLSADSELPGFCVKGLLKDDYDDCYRAAQGKESAEITITFEEAQKISVIVLKENIRLSQRIEHFKVMAGLNGDFKEISDGTVVGYKRIVSLAQSVTADTLRICITDSRCEPDLAFVGIY